LEGCSLSLMLGTRDPEDESPRMDLLMLRVATVFFGDLSLCSLKFLMLQIGSHLAPKARPLLPLDVAMQKSTYKSGLQIHSQVQLHIPPAVTLARGVPSQDVPVYRLRVPSQDVPVHRPVGYTTQTRYMYHWDTSDVPLMPVG
jgi:hypothetical protein